MNVVRYSTNGPRTDNRVGGMCSFVDCQPG